MTPLLTREQIQAYDTHAIRVCRVPGLVLMENAGRGAAEILLELLADGEVADPVVIVCGPGNNGGDGFVVGRHLLQDGWLVQVLLMAEAEQVSGDARANLDAFVGLGGAVTELTTTLEAPQLDELLTDAGVLVDAIFGTGLTRAVAGRYRMMIEALNRSAAPCLALDIPSGIDSDSGEVLGAAITADTTATFAHVKIGMMLREGPERCGDIEVVPLGLPDTGILDEIGYRAQIIEPEHVAETLPTRATDAHKYNAGSVLVIAGSAGKSGAAVLTATAALRAGAGVVTLASWPDALPAMAETLSEAMTAPLDDSDLAACLDPLLHRRGAVAIGPGLGLDDRSRRAVEHVVLSWDGPVVVDADAISHFAGRAEQLAQAPGPRILTPHSGELARLMATRSDQVEADRLGAVEHAAETTGCTVVLKGRHTLVATPEGTTMLCNRGGPCLATAGSGDVLTGILAALAGSLSPHDAASAGVLVHAMAGDRWADSVGADQGMLAGDIVAQLPELMASLHDRE